MTEFTKMAKQIRKQSNKAKLIKAQQNEITLKKM